MKKIFGIGLSRTGTTSLSNALKQVGIDIIHYPTKSKLYDKNSRGACDIPVAAQYKDLDKKFANSKFVYTVRNKEDWLNSIEKYLERKKNATLGEWQRENRIKIYGQVEFDRKIFSEKYDEHDESIRQYFKERKNDLLILNICDGDEWMKLATFLDIDNDSISKFPHSNKRKKA